MEETIMSNGNSEFINTENNTKILTLENLGNFLASQDNAKNSIYFHDVPEICKNVPCMLGVDEAGRGPVLGPMVYGISFCPIESKKVLVNLGCADSKQLTEEKREHIFEELSKNDESRPTIGWAVEVISPNIISSGMYQRTKCSLNEVSMDSAIGLIHRAVDAGVNIAEIYVDTVGPPEKYQAKLKAIFPYFEITVAKKADSTYPIVSMASICAKVTRDHALKVWKFPEGITCENFGSGYPGDPSTKTFLINNIDLVFGFPRLVRFSWSTAEKALEGKAYDMIFEDPEDENKKAAYGGGISGFFKKTIKCGIKDRDQCEFLTERHLQSTMDL